MTQPLQGIKVLDFSTLLPGPLCTLLLAEAGAEVIKLERPARGDEMRAYAPKVGDDSANFVLLNRGKQSIALDLKAADAVARLTPLIREADVLVEQFRPGVMARLGLGYDAVAAINPRLIYCSITGYGQDGPYAQEAGHDLNYVASSGMLAMSAPAGQIPGLPPALIADVAGGAYPAMINILLALRQRDVTQAGTHLDIAMAENLFTFQYWGLGNGWCGAWPAPAADLVNGGSPRYQVYQTADGKHLAAAPIEAKFWSNFVTLIGLDETHLATLTPQDVMTAVAHAIAARSADEWVKRFAGQDVCTVKVVGLEDASRDLHFAARGVFARRIDTGAGKHMPALPVPIVPAFRGADVARRAPGLGEHNDRLPAAGVTENTAGNTTGSASRS
ncbi:CoA transferase [Imbroritus primus]|uniref:CoA transferase n=1 Tax=Imbroritus primus TaxID=3058603 RepID=A0ACD3SPX8_9BURK|nr:CoA transferase [Burkholderiaceae bacterium PBA]